MKTLRIFAVLAFFQSLGSEAQTVVLPTTTETMAQVSQVCPASPQITDLVNTGFEACTYPGANQDCEQLTATVWDGPSASLYWQQPGTITSGKISLIGLTINTSPGTGVLTGVVDPDVVVLVTTTTPTPNSKILVVASAVSANATLNGSICWMIFNWNSGSNSFVLDASRNGILGKVSSTTCSNPNIDMNEGGLVVITWAESSTKTTNITTTNPVFGPVAMNYLRSDIYAAYGSITGGGMAGLVAKGDLISPPPAVNRLFEKNITPDVAVGPKFTMSSGATNLYVTFTWMQEWFDPATFQISRQVVARRYGFEDGFNNGPLVTYNFGCVGQLGRPRIAARPLASGYTSGLDFQVVMAGYANGCTPGNCAGGGCSGNTSSYIYNWGSHNGAIQAGNTLIGGVYSPINLAFTMGITTYVNNDAVISYLFKDNASMPTGGYVVSWVNAPGIATCAGLPSTSGYDILAKTFSGGAVLAGTSNNTFSLVNKNFCGASGQVGDQLFPSIAGRHVKHSMGNAYWNSQVGNTYMAVKMSHCTGTMYTPGQTAALGGNHMPVLDIDPQENKETKGHFGIQPNPSSNKVNFRLDLDEKEHPHSIEVFGMNGVLVYSANLNGSSNLVEWIPGDSLKPGMYIVRLTTSSGTYEEKMLREE